MEEPDLRALPDNELADKANEIYQELMNLPRWDGRRDSLIEEWQACIGEMDYRAGISVWRLLM